VFHSYIRRVTVEGCVGGEGFFVGCKSWSSLSSPFFTINLARGARAGLPVIQDRLIDSIDIVSVEGLILSVVMCLFSSSSTKIRI